KRGWRLSPHIAGQRRARARRREHGRFPRRARRGAAARSCARAPKLDRRRRGLWRRPRALRRTRSQGRNGAARRYRPARRGPASAYYDFFARDVAGRATHYFDWVNLENLNFDNPEVRNYVLEAFAYWLREFDVDGFRVDASWGVTQRAPDFWPLLRQEL